MPGRSIRKTLISGSGFICPSLLSPRRVAIYLLIPTCAKRCAGTVSVAAVPPGSPAHTGKQMPFILGPFQAVKNDDKMGVCSILRSIDCPGTPVKDTIDGRRPCFIEPGKHQLFAASYLQLFIPMAPQELSKGTRRYAIL
jgi:hypothetical protein